MGKRPVICVRTTLSGHPPEIRDRDWDTKFGSGPGQMLAGSASREENPPRSIPLPDNNCIKKVNFLRRRRFLRRFFLRKNSYFLTQLF